MPKLNVAKAQSMATKAVTRVMAKKLSKLSLERQVEWTHFAMGLAGMTSVRKDLLGEAGLCLDIEEKLKAGQAPKEIKAYFWDCKPWRELWVDTMKCEEGMLDLLIKQEVTKRGNG